MGYYSDFEKSPLPVQDLRPVPPARTAQPAGMYRARLKRLVDILLVCLSAPVWLPVVAALALFIRRDGGPAFYTQKRVGRDGTEFEFLKLRTMIVGADDYLRAYLAENPAAKAEWDLHQKLQDDPRITGFGRFLRKSSLDELPQLLNVLRGDMSIVGPRPMMPNQKSLYPGTAYYRMRPGLT
ncbi:MAG: sugar transferase, partial [Pseudomonadota bacterium]